VHIRARRILFTAAVGGGRGCIVRPLAGSPLFPAPHPPPARYYFARSKYLYARERVLFIKIARRSGHRRGRGTAQTQSALSGAKDSS